MRGTPGSSLFGLCQAFPVQPFLSQGGEKRSGSRPRSLTFGNDAEWRG